MCSADDHDEHPLQHLVPTGSAITLLAALQQVLAHPLYMYLCLAIWHKCTVMSI